jgi:hypothetical protein
MLIELNDPTAPATATAKRRFPAGTDHATRHQPTMVGAVFESAQSRASHHQAGMAVACWSRAPTLNIKSCATTVA